METSPLAGTRRCTTFPTTPCSSRPSPSAQPIPRPPFRPLASRWRGTPPAMPGQMSRQPARGRRRNRPGRPGEVPSPPRQRTPRRHRTGRQPRRRRSRPALVRGGREPKPGQSQLQGPRRLQTRLNSRRAARAESPTDRGESAPCRRPPQQAQPDHRPPAPAVDYGSCALGGRAGRALPSHTLPLPHDQESIGL